MAMLEVITDAKSPKGGVIAIRFVLHAGQRQEWVVGRVDGVMGGLLLDITHICHNTSHFSNWLALKGLKLHVVRANATRRKR